MEANDTPGWLKPRTQHYGKPVHPRELDTWTSEVQPGLTVAVDAASCIVVHTRAGTFTVSDVLTLVDKLLYAKILRDLRQRRISDPEAIASQLVSTVMRQADSVRDQVTR